MHDVHEPAARQIAAIFYPVVQRGENHLSADLLRRRFVDSAPATEGYEGGLAYALHRAWIIKDGDSYEITQAGCFDH